MNIQNYLYGTRDDVRKLAGSLFPLDYLDTTAYTQMRILQNECRASTETLMKERLEKVKYKIAYDSLSAICGSERIEVVSGT